MFKFLVAVVSVLVMAVSVLAYDGGGICDWMPKDSDTQKYDGGGVGD